MQCVTDPFYWFFKKGKFSKLESKELIEISLENAIPKRDVGFLYRHNTLKENTAVEGFISYIKERIH